MSKKVIRIVGFLMILFILVLITTTFILPKFKSAKDESSENIDLPIRQGQFVKKGDLLIRLGDREKQLALVDARNSLLTARGEYEIKKLDRRMLQQLVDSTALQKFALMEAEWKEAQQHYKNGEINKATYNSKRLNYLNTQILTGVRHKEVIASKTGFSSAINAYERAKLNLSQLTITAPFTGIIGGLNVQPGQYVSASTECCKIVDFSRVRINVGVLESEIQHLKIGRSASIQLPAYPNEKFVGKIVTINPIINPEIKARAGAGRTGDYFEALCAGA